MSNAPPRTAANSKPNKSSLDSGRTVTLWPLVGAIYLMVAGGPYGLEELVGMTGYRGAILVLVLVALLWALPIALMVTELSTAIPEDGGYYTWVERAMGPFWGFQEAWLSLVASLFDMAIYPALFLLYLGRVWPQYGTGWRGMLVGLAMIAICAAWNLRTAGTVAGSSFLFTLLILSPFVVLVFIAFWHPGSAIAVTTRPSQVDWLGGIIVAMWNMMSWDGASTFAGEVVEPRRTLPRAMTIAVLLVTLSYAVPILAMSHAGIPATGWDTGSWVDHARAVAGSGLAAAMMIGGMLGSFGMFNSLVLSYSRVPMVMAEDGFLPRLFARRSLKTQAPWVAVIALSIGWALCMNFGFTRLVLLDVMLTGLSLVLEFAALIALRIREPGLERPFRLPGGVIGTVLLTLAPTVLIVAAAVRNRDEHAGPISSFALGVTLIVAGVLIYFASGRRYARQN